MMVKKITKKAIKEALEYEGELTVGKDLSGKYIWKQDSFSKLVYQVRGEILIIIELGATKKHVLDRIYKKYYKKGYDTLPFIPDR